MTEARRLTIDDMISRSEAAEILGCHPNTIDRLRVRKELTAYRKPGQHRLYYDRAEVEMLDRLEPVEDAS